MVGYDPETKRFKVEPEQKKPTEKGKKVYRPLYRITEPQFNKILGFAEQDGFSLYRIGKDNKKVLDRGKVSRTINTILNQIIGDWITEREAG